MNPSFHSSAADPIGRQHDLSCMNLGGLHTFVFFFIFYFQRNILNDNNKVSLQYSTVF